MREAPREEISQEEISQEEPGGERDDADAALAVGVTEADRAAAKEAYEKGLAEATGSADRVQLLKRAMTLDPTSGVYQKSLANAYYDSGDYKLAIETSLSGAKLLPNDSLLRTLLGAAYFEEKKFDEALAAHEDALKIDPNNLYSRFNLALTLQGQDSPRALAAWEEYLRLSEGKADQEAIRARALEYYDDLKARDR